MSSIVSNLGTVHEEGCQLAAARDYKGARQCAATLGSRASVESGNQDIATACQAMRETLLGFDCYIEWIELTDVDFIKTAI